MNLTALLRDAQGVAVPDLPLTLVVKRPDGVEYRRAAVADARASAGAPAAAAAAGRAARHLAGRGLYRPEGPALGEATFLVEDYVPERLELTLTSATAQP